MLRRLNGVHLRFFLGGNNGLPFCRQLNLMIFRLLAFTAACTFCLPASPACGQELFGYTSGRGVITFTSRKPEGRAYWVVRPRQPSFSTIIQRGWGYRWSSHPRPSQYDELILELSKLYQLEPALVKAVMHVESAFNSSARSSAGAMGLMQLMPDTARRFGIRNAYHPIENVVGGMRYLRWLFEHFNGNVHNMLAGYNAGENAVHRFGGIPPYNETQNYVRRVLELRDMYRGDYSGAKG